MRAIVVRHFKTLINAAGLIMGWGDAPPVKGWETDLVYVDDVLKTQGIPLSAIYTSDLGRARRSGMFYAQSRGIHLIHDSAALNEINYGDLFRKSKRWVERTIPEHKTDPDFIYPNGESFRQMQQRTVAFFESLCSRRPDQTILVVVHAGVIRGLVSHSLDLPYAENLRRHISHRYIGDFRFEGGRCIRYDELGEPSGFVAENVLEMPVERASLRAIGD